MLPKVKPPSPSPDVGAAVEERVVGEIAVVGEVVGEKVSPGRVGV
jgi:hypothetical protein